MTRNLPTRRDFLKVAALLPFAWAARPGFGRLKPSGAEGQPNVILLVFDAWSADHVQFHGYPRRTMPNLERFADRATVFHNHYSAGTFTVPGTASLLTGMHPWSHRALSLGSAGVDDRHADHHAFAVFADTHHTIGYAQNKFADVFLYQWAKYLDVHLSSGAFNLERRFAYNLPFFENDAQAAFAALESNLLRDGGGESSALFLNPLFRLLRTGERRAAFSKYSKLYPRGLPDDSEQFLLGDVVDGAIRELGQIDEPAFAYFHFYPPHENYCPTGEFFKRFSGGWQPPDKPIHRLAWARHPRQVLNEACEYNDEYLASWDAETGRLFEFLHDSGLFERSYLVITADHGELFERGEKGHFTPMVFEPLVHVPLIVSRPGQTRREDVHAVTSSVDLLPTLAHLLDKPVPAWTEGLLLPGFGGTEDTQRSVFSMDAKENPAFAPLRKSSLSLTKERRRLTCYDYPEGRQFEFYDLDRDPEELHDLYPENPTAAREMEAELTAKLDEVNAPFDSG